MKQESLGEQHGVKVPEASDPQELHCSAQAPEELSQRATGGDGCASSPLCRPVETRGGSCSVRRLPAAAAAMVDDAAGGVCLSPGRQHGQHDVREKGDAWWERGCQREA